MKAEEAWKIAMSKPAQDKKMAGVKARAHNIIQDILNDVKSSSASGKTETTYYLQDAHNFEEQLAAEDLAFSELRKMNYKVKIKWLHIGQRRIIWEHALTKPANDVMKGMLTDSWWTKIKKFFIPG